MFTVIQLGETVVDLTTGKIGRVIGYENESLIKLEVEGTEVTSHKLNVRPVKQKSQPEYKPYEDIVEFHTAFSHPVATKPTPMTPERATQRTDYLVEEAVEFLWASVAGDRAHTEELVDKLVVSVHNAMKKCLSKGEFPKEDILLNQIDAVNDIQYINTGTMVEMGAHPAPFHKIIHNANMNKLGADGKPIINPETNKIMKPEGWEENFKPEPLLEAELKRQLGE